MLQVLGCLCPQTKQACTLRSDAVACWFTMVDGKMPFLGTLPAQGQHLWHKREGMLPLSSLADPMHVAGP